MSCYYYLKLKTHETNETNEILYLISNPAENLTIILENLVVSTKYMENCHPQVKITIDLNAKRGYFENINLKYKDNECFLDFYKRLYDVAKLHITVDLIKLKQKLYFELNSIKYEFIRTIHAKNRMSEREISKDRIYNVLKNLPKNKTEKYEFNGLIVIAMKNDETKTITIITTYSIKDKHKEPKIIDTRIYEEEDESEYQSVSQSVSELQIVSNKLVSNSQNILIEKVKSEVIIENMKSIVEIEDERIFKSKKMEYECKNCED